MSEFKTVTANSTGAMDWWINSYAGLGWNVSNITTIDGPFGGDEFVITFEKGLCNAR